MGTDHLEGVTCEQLNPREVIGSWQEGHPALIRSRTLTKSPC